MDELAKALYDQEESASAVEVVEGLLKGILYGEVAMKARIQAGRFKESKEIAEFFRKYGFYVDEKVVSEMRLGEDLYGWKFVAQKAAELVTAGSSRTDEGRSEVRNVALKQERSSQPGLESSRKKEGAPKKRVESIRGHVNMASLRKGLELRVSWLIKNGASPEDIFRSLFTATRFGVTSIKGASVAALLEVYRRDGNFQEFHQAETKAITGQNLIRSEMRSDEKKSIGHHPVRVDTLAVLSPYEKRLIAAMVYVMKGNIQEPASEEAIRILENTGVVPMLTPEEVKYYLDARAVMTGAEEYKQLNPYLPPEAQNELQEKLKFKSVFFKARMSLWNRLLQHNEELS